MFTIRGGYHGDTFAPMSVCDPVGGMHSLFTGVLPEQIFAPRPPAGINAAADDPAMVAWEQQTRELYGAHAAEVAAVVIEPVLQGAGGMHIYSPYVVQVLASLAREHGALLIFDEIATGFGRTGTLWAADRCGVVPDILTVGKALTGGYLTLAAMLCTRAVAEGVRASNNKPNAPTGLRNPRGSLLMVDLPAVGPGQLRAGPRMSPTTPRADRHRTNNISGVAGAHLRGRDRCQQGTARRTVAGPRKCRRTRRRTS
jgi:adenosylmethionine-8-amino-7-oxononanoate aminotransferase